MIEWQETERGIGSDDWRWLIRKYPDGWCIRDYTTEEWVRNNFKSLEEAKQYCENVNAADLRGISNGLG